LKVRIKDEGNGEWTSTSIKIGRKFGLMVRAEKNHRSYGQELEEILVKAGVSSINETQYQKQKAELKENRK
jgi:hypothetical protein